MFCYRYWHKDLSFWSKRQTLQFRVILSNFYLQRKSFVAFVWNVYVTEGAQKPCHVTDAAILRDSRPDGISSDEISNVDVSVCLAYHLHAPVTRDILTVKQWFQKSRNLEQLSQVNQKSVETETEAKIVARQCDYHFLNKTLLYLLRKHIAAFKSLWFGVTDIRDYPKWERNA